MTSLDYVKQFVQEQHNYLGLYAKAGERDSKRSPDARMPSPAHTALLKTPVLKPRVPVTQLGNLRKVNEEKSITKGKKNPPNGTSARSGWSRLVLDEMLKKPRPISRKTRKPRIRTITLRMMSIKVRIDYISCIPLIDSEGSRERRERRREKRAILQGLPPNREGNDFDEPAAAKKTRQEHASRDTENRRHHKPGKSGKVPLGVALMESFTAKNTKKDRLTVRDSAEHYAGETNIQASTAKTKRVQRRVQQRERVCTNTDHQDHKAG